MGFLLPCTVVVSESNGGAEVSLQRPEGMFRVADNPDLQTIATEPEQRLVRALERS